MSELVVDRHPDMVVHKNAIVTPKKSGEVANVFSGEAYASNGDLIPLSMRDNTAVSYKNVPRAVSILDKASVDRVHGKFLFVGLVFEMFGHDLLELTSRLWPFVADSSFDCDGLVVLAWNETSSDEKIRDNVAASSILEFFAGKMPVFIVRRPTCFETLIVPEAAFKINSYALEICRTLFLRMRAACSEAQLSGPDKIYFSRRLLHTSPRFSDESALERVFAKFGYTILHPQALGFWDQVGLMRQAKQVAGLDGSAMHLVLFSSSDVDVHVVDTRKVVNQFIVEELSGVRSIHIAAEALEVQLGRDLEGALEKYISRS